VNAASVGSSAESWRTKWLLAVLVTTSGWHPEPGNQAAGKLGGSAPNGLLEIIPKLSMNYPQELRHSSQALSIDGKRESVGPRSVVMLPGSLRQRSHGPGGHAGVTVCPKRSPRQHGVQIGETLLRGGQRRVVCTGNVVDTNVPLSSQVTLKGPSGDKRSFYNGNATGQLTLNVKAPRTHRMSPLQYCVLEEN
ncbi:hypothetical protein KUCAC02_010161, partial [Chaenocephalus aceratus]